MERQVIHTDQAPKAIGPYSQAIRIGNFVFSAGPSRNTPFTAKFVCCSSSHWHIDGKRRQDDCVLERHERFSKNEHGVRRILFIESASSFDGPSRALAERWQCRNRSGRIALK